MSGPLRGYYVAAYACPVGELGEEYIGYYKLFAGEPESYWESECLLKGCSDSRASSAEQAVNDAFRSAADEVANLPYLPTRLRSRRADDPTLPLAELKWVIARSKP
ncbi:MAG: hypothetical protein ABIT82_08740 [Ramlibacter sp.]